MYRFLLEIPFTYETNIVLKEALISDNISVHQCTIHDILINEFQYIMKDAVPVGSVKFVQNVMWIRKIQEPANISYPHGSEKYLNRTIKQTTKEQLKPGCFVKPMLTKLFTGFIYDTGKIHDGMSNHDKEQFFILNSLPNNTELWISDMIEFVSEWRYYVQEGKIIGKAKYDDNEKTGTEPNINIVKQCILDLEIYHPYVIDFGVTVTGKTSFIEVNDAWGIGLYEDCLTGKRFINFLDARWRSLLTFNMKGNL
jgi:hypothetical protein